MIVVTDVDTKELFYEVTKLSKLKWRDFTIEQLEKYSITYVKTNRCIFIEKEYLTYGDIAAGEKTDKYITATNYINSFKQKQKKQKYLLVNL